MSSELISKEQSWNLSRTNIEQLVELATKLAGSDEPEAATPKPFSPNDCRLIYTVEQLLSIKRALLADQSLLNDAARRSVVEEKVSAPLICLACFG